jgi:hypothetical protein
MTRASTAEAKTKPNGQHVAVGEKRVRDAAGRVRTLRVLDLKSPTFGADLLYVFGRNVAKARRDNKRVIGAADVVPRSRSG